MESGRLRSKCKGCLLHMNWDFLLKGAAGDIKIPSHWAPFYSPSLPLSLCLSLSLSQSSSWAPHWPKPKTSRWWPPPKVVFWVPEHSGGIGGWRSRSVGQVEGHTPEPQQLLLVNHWSLQLHWVSIQSRMESMPTRHSAIILILLNYMRRGKLVLENQLAVFVWHNFSQKVIELGEDRNRDQYRQEEFSPVSPKAPIEIKVTDQ